MSSPAARLRERILSRRARVGVVGLDYAGLPLAVEFARSRFRTVGIDLDTRKIAAIPPPVPAARPSSEAAGKAG